MDPVWKGVGVFVVLMGIVLCGPAIAQDYPVKPVRVIVPFAPGGITDNSVRVIADKLSARLGQQVVIENRPGAGGNIGTAAVAQALPDGYTLVLGYDGTFAINPHLYPKMPFDGFRDFAPIGRLGDATLILVAHPSVQVRTLADLVALAKQKPGALSFGSAGTATAGHVAMELLCLQLGINIVHVPYKGGAPALLDVVSGQIPLVSTFIASAAQYVKQGRVIALGVSSGKRDPALPDVPTFSEGGAQGYAVTSWLGLLAPAKTPRAIIDRLNRDIELVMNEPEVRERYATLGIVPSPGSTEAFTGLIRSDYERWGKVVKQAGIKIE
ncbi:MAG: Bug family tripartite tricarboxylate transporter substrate binding protein [Burkholderiales bacterium]